MKDIEIARKSYLKPITEIANELNIEEDNIELYGKNKAKILNKVYENFSISEDGKLILVTAINPTPLGEGKTTISIGLADAINKCNENCILALREPSLGPVFGIKGGATGGGYAQIAPMEDINLHFTGDIHAITTANNLLSALIDNHIYFGNELKFKTVVWKRCLDLNDRQLRKIECGLSEEKSIIPREDGFDISVASEIMAILCLAKDIKDLKRRIGNIVVGYNEENIPIKASDLNVEGSLTVILKDAIKPNLVQTLENNPAIVHGGPFANIAHGCNSVIATKLALKLSDYVVTEAGFGADLGAEKFLDIKCRNMNINPSVVVCVATIKALKYHGGLEKIDINKNDLIALEKGFQNLYRHVDNLKNKFGLNVIIAINKYSNDSEEEINFCIKMLKENNIEYSLAECWEHGGNGALDLAQKVIKLSEKACKFNYIYNLNDSVKEKINKVAKKIYGAEKVNFNEESEKQIKQIEELGYGELPICIAKTQYSFSDDPKNLEITKSFDINVNKVILKAGAEFIVVITGKIMTMPGLPKVPSAEKIDIDKDENIIGIF